MTIYIIRHGQTSWNIQGRKQGTLDSPLTLAGIKQASVVPSKLAESNTNFTNYKILSSPSFRARQTAKIVYEILKINNYLILEDLIVEHGFGAWGGLTEREIKLKFPGKLESREKNRWDYIVPGGGESYAAIFCRAKLFIERYSISQNMILFTHQVFSKVLRGSLLGTKREKILDMKHPHDVIFKYENGLVKVL